MYFRVPQISANVPRSEAIPSSNREAEVDDSLWFDLGDLNIVGLSEMELHHAIDSVLKEVLDAHR